METFESPLGSVELTSERLVHILMFHPEIRSVKKYFKRTLLEPSIMRRSNSDSKVFILYRAVTGQKLLAIVIKTNSRNFILTAYITKKIQHQDL